MKKLFLPTLLITLSALLFYSCNTGSGEAYNIKMRLNKGDTFVQDMQMDMLMNTSGMEMKMKMDAGVTFDVTNSNTSEKDIKITYTKMNMGMDMGNLKRRNISDSVLNNTYQNLIGKSVTIKLSKDNEITDVSGFEEIMNSRVRDSAQNEGMKKMFSKDQLNSMFGIMFSMYPKKPVKVGESWNSETTTKMANMDMKVANKYTLISVRNGLADISIDGTLGLAGDVKQATGMKMDMSGTQKGTITIRIDNGYLHTASYKLDVTAEMQMMGQKMPLTMHANYNMKGI